MSGVLKINGKQVNPAQLNNWRMYRKNPVEVRAVRIGEPFEVETLNGIVKCEAGEWLIEGVAGELYPCKNDIFEQTYGREQTKIVPISCRDCGDKITVFAGSSANIIEVRCPKCTKEFQRKGEEHNLKLGYTKYGEAPSPLALSGMADNGAFGLEYLFQGLWDEKIRNLLLEGIAFIENALKEKDNEAARKIKEELEKIIEEKGKTVPDVMRIREMQHFFNTESAPYMRQALNEQQRREKARRL